MFLHHRPYSISTLIFHADKFIIFLPSIFSIYSPSFCITFLYNIHRYSNNINNGSIHFMLIYARVFITFLKVSKHNIFLWQNFHAILPLALWLLFQPCTYFFHHYIFLPTDWLHFTVNFKQSRSMFSATTSLCTLFLAIFSLYTITSDTYVIPPFQVMVVVAVRG